jgi:methyltransferase
MMLAMASPSLVALAVVLATMLAEARLSALHERALLAMGARLVPDASYPWMRVAYPMGFVAVCLEGWWRQVPWSAWALLGVMVFALGKLIKYVAIATLGPRWSFRVLVVPGAPLVASGIYRVLRHPNYVGVAGEVIGVGLWLQAPIAGTLFVVTFGLILLWRIRIEERALGLAPRA